MPQWRTSSLRAPVADRGRSTCSRGIHSLRPRALRSDDLHLHSFLSGRARRPCVSDPRLLAPLVRRPVHPSADRRRQGRIHRSVNLAAIVTVLPSSSRSSPVWRFDATSAATAVFTLMIGSLVAPGLVLGLGVGLLFSASARGALVHIGARRAAVLDAAVRRAGDVRRDVAVRPCMGGSGSRSGATRWQTIGLVIIPIACARSRRCGVVRLHPLV